MRIVIYGLLLILFSACAPYIKKSMDPISRDHILEMRTIYYSMDGQQGYAQRHRYRMVGNWKRPKKPKSDTEVAFDFNEGATIFDDFHDTLFIALRDTTLKHPFTDYTSGIERIRSEESVREIKHHNFRILITPEQQAIIQESYDATLVLKRGQFRAQFKINSSMLNSWKSFFFFEKTYPYR